MKNFFLSFLLILNFIKIIIGYNMPCSVKVLQTEQRGIPCKGADVEILQSKLLSSYFDITTIKKLTITGWYYLENVSL